jgi:hypothetical protein
MRTLFRHPRRVWRVLAVFFTFFIAPALHLPGGDRRPGPAVASPRAWAAPILGQMLALRFDLLPAAILTSFCSPEPVERSHTPMSVVSSW